MEWKPSRRSRDPRVVTLWAVEATPESFAPFGQVIVASRRRPLRPPRRPARPQPRHPEVSIPQPLQIPISTAPANHPPPLFPGPYTQIVTFSPLSALAGSGARRLHRPPRCLRIHGHRFPNPPAPPLLSSRTLLQRMCATTGQHPACGLEIVEVVVV
jgi:hypothetical protein